MRSSACRCLPRASCVFAGRPVRLGTERRSRSSHARLVFFRGPPPPCGSTAFPRLISVVIHHLADARCEGALWLGGGCEIKGWLCRFMTHPPALCANCMSQGEFVTGRARGGQRATVRFSRLALPIWRRRCLW